jgi:hypothetical protein
MISADAQRFREKVLDALGTNPSEFWYVDADNCVATCPVCESPLGVRFHGNAARADLWCHGGCVEDEVTEAIQRKAAR